MMVIKRIFIFMVFCVISACAALASNLQISNLDQVNVNTAAKTITFSFNLTQDNSWSGPDNNDAVWVFMKYSPDGGVTWQHAHMLTSGVNPAGFSIPTQFQNQFQIIVPSDRTGFFLQRSGPGTGSINLTGLQFVWYYLGDGVSDATALAASTLHTIFGIEMVYIPQGPFYAGDSNGTFSLEYPLGGNNPWYIQSESDILATAIGGAYYYQYTGAAGDEYGSGYGFHILGSFPKGYNAFYLMKYELTEGQWVSFFNTLPVAARPYRDITSSNLRTGGKGSSAVVNRNTISWNSLIPASPATTLRPSRPVSFVSWPDVAAYAEWAGLRPITELEFEKAARGKDKTVNAGEFVWGQSAPATAAPGAISSNENGSEKVGDGSNVNGNSSGFTSGDGLPDGIAAGQAGPLRVGIFAASAPNPTRQSTGAGFYGNMELSGNLAQPVVTIGRAEGLNFQGSEGTGILNSSGFATNGDWPGYDSGTSQVDSTVGIGYRGGDFQSPNTTPFMISARTFAVRDPDSQGGGCTERGGTSCGIFYGGRLGRSAP